MFDPQNHEVEKMNKEKKSNSKWLHSKKGSIYKRTGYGTIVVFKNKFKKDKWKVSFHSPKTGLHFLQIDFNSQQTALSFIQEIDFKAFSVKPDPKLEDWK